MTNNIPAMDVATLKANIDQGKDFILVDVREASELAICKIPQATHIPLGELPNRFAELPNDKPIIVYCHHGGRSARAVSFLQQQSLTHAINLTGGIHAWAQQIDPTMETY